MQFMAIGFIFASLLLSKQAYANSCSSYQLQLQNCLLKTKSSQVAVTKEKINYFDQTYREILDFPVKENAADWQWVELTRLGGRQLLQIKIWKNSNSNLGIQALDWFVYELLPNKPKEKIVLLYQGEIQTRRKDLEVKSSDKVQIMPQDPQIKHSLSLDKNQNIEITHGSKVITVGGSKNGI